MTPVRSARHAAAAADCTAPLVLCLQYSSSRLRDDRSARAGDIIWAVHGLLQAYLDDRTPRGVILLKGNARRQALGILGKFVYDGSCCYWLGKANDCSQRSRCPRAASHVAGVPSVFARLLNRLPLDDRPEVQVRRFECGHIDIQHDIDIRGC